MKKLLIGSAAALGIVSCYLFFPYRRQKPRGPAYQKRKMLYQNQQDNPNPHFVTRMPNKIGIIGAGAAGIITAKTLHQQGFHVEVLERNHDIGGVWLQNYDGAGLQTGMEHYQIADFAYDQEMRLFPVCSQLKNYFDEYIDHFNIRHLFKFNKEVLKTEQREDGSWVVFLSSGKYKVYDFLVIAVGAFNEPFIPDFPDKDKFQGKLMHSSEFVNAQDLVKGKKIVVIGSNKSAVDISTTCRDYGASQVTSLRRNGFYLFDFDQLPTVFDHPSPVDYIHSRVFQSLHPHEDMFDSWIYRIVNPLRNYFFNTIQKKICYKIDERLIPDVKYINFIARYCDNKGFNKSIKEGVINLQKGAVTRFTANGLVTESGEIEADVVIAATGFNRKYYAYNDDGLDGPFLYRYTLKPYTTNTVSIGFIQCTHLLTGFNLQAVWLAEILRGNVKLPSHEVMQADVDKKVKFTLSWYAGRSIRYFMQPDIYVFDPILQDMGVSTNRFSNV